MHIWPIFFRHCHYWQFLFPRTFRSCFKKNHNKQCKTHSSLSTLAPFVFSVISSATMSSVWFSMSCQLSLGRWALSLEPFNIDIDVFCFVGRKIQNDTWENVVTWHGCVAWCKCSAHLIVLTRGARAAAPPAFVSSAASQLAPPSEIVPNKLQLSRTHQIALQGKGELYHVMAHQ
jgi:hypothetical protein